MTASEFYHTKNKQKNKNTKTGTYSLSTVYIEGNNTTGFLMSGSFLLDRGKDNGEMLET